MGERTPSVSFKHTDRQRQEQNLLPSTLTLQMQKPRENMEMLGLQHTFSIVFYDTFHIEVVIQRELETIPSLQSILTIKCNNVPMKVYFPFTLFCVSEEYIEATGPPLVNHVKPTLKRDGQYFYSL